jgi:hypothetical protein
MLSVPLSITGALMALWWTGISLNIYSQIGIIMLLGLMAKNGILIVEFANQLRDQGYSVRDAIVEGAVLRFRPVLMTTISTVFGAVPLVLATGAGADATGRIDGGVVSAARGVAEADICGTATDQEWGASGTVVGAGIDAVEVIREDRRLSVSADDESAEEKERN